MFSIIHHKILLPSGLAAQQRPRDRKEYENNEATDIILCISSVPAIAENKSAL